MLFVVLAFFAFGFSSSIDTAAENLSIFLVLILYFCKYLVIVYVLTWKFFSDSNVMVKESNVIFFPLQSTNIKNGVQIRPILYSSQPITL